MTLASGTRLGPYEIIAPIGAGGMGEVYRARDTRLGRDVAVKVLPQNLSASNEDRTRFKREAKTISSLNHPHICVLHDVGQEGDTDFLVMELVDGETLAQRISRGPLPTADVLRLGAEIADALDRAHRAGVIHRDLKPSNVMLTKTGAKLMDFGLARAMQRTARGADHTTETMPEQQEPITAKGTVIGTLQYMSPEQLEGTGADARSDIWALGCVLYEMTTGRRAFQGSTPASVISAIMRDQPRVMAGLAPMTPPALERVALQCLSKDPDDRWQSAGDLRRELQWIAEGGVGSGIIATVPRRRAGIVRLAWISSGAAIGAVLMLAMGHFARRASESKSAPVRFSIETPAGVRDAGSPKISPDGRYVAFSAEETTGVRRVWLRSLSELTARPLIGTEGAFRPFWSPDSRSIGFIAEGKLKRIAVVGGPPVTVCEAATGVDGTWSRTGTILYDGDGSTTITQVSASGGVPSPATAVDRSRGEIGSGWPQFLPDGIHFLYVGYLDSRDSVVLRVGRLGSKWTKVLEVGKFSRLEYVAEGYLLYARGRTLLARRFDAKRLELSGDPIPVVDAVNTEDVAGGNADFSVSAVGTLVYRNQRTPRQSQLVWRDRGGRNLGKVGPVADFWNIALSPDGQRVAATITGSNEFDTDVWMFDLARDVATRFAFGSAAEGHPVWSADGSKLFCTSATTPGLVHVFQMPSSGMGSRRELRLPGTSVIPHDASRDGRHLACVFRDSVGNWDIAMVGLGAEPQVLPVLTSTFQEWEPSLSPDGKWLAYTSNQRRDYEGAFQVYVVDYPGLTGMWQISNGGGHDPQWGADGRQLFFLGPAGELMSSAIATAPSFHASKAVRLFDISPFRLEVWGGGRNYAITAGGSRFLVLEPAVGRGSPQMIVAENWTGALRGK